MGIAQLMQQDKQKRSHLKGAIWHLGTLIGLGDELLMESLASLRRHKHNPNPKLSDEKSDSRQVMQSQTHRGHELVGKVEQVGLPKAIGQQGSCHSLAS